MAFTPCIYDYLHLKTAMSTGVIPTQKKLNTKRAKSSRKAMRKKEAYCLIS